MPPRRRAGAARRRRGGAAGRGQAARGPRGAGAALAAPGHDGPAHRRDLGDEPPETARNAVQVYVSGLRKALRDGVVIERAGRRATASSAPSWSVDSARFESQVSRGRGSALRAGDAPRAARGVLTGALAAWGGAPLCGLESLPFHAEASRSPGRHTGGGATDRAEGLLRAGDTDEAARAAQEVTRERPFEERAWGLLATARYHGGRQAEALETCRELRLLLDKEARHRPVARARDARGAHPQPGPRDPGGRRGQPRRAHDGRRPGHERAAAAA